MEQNSVAVIVADGEIDSVQDYGPDCVAHVKDLRKMGCTVKIRLFNPIDASNVKSPWERAQAWADNFAG